MPNLYKLARTAGLNPNHWFAVERSDSLRRGMVREVMFWEQSIALFRGNDGSVGAIANRCAHRNIKLTLGNVCKSYLVCPYHGWEYDISGRVVRIPHDLFGRTTPQLCVPSYPVRERFGLVWLFPGDPARAEHVAMPTIPELEASKPWASVHIDFVWRAHFSIIVENLLDFTHSYLHRKYRPFDDAVLVRLESRDDRVSAEYKVVMAAGRFSGLFVNRSRVDTGSISSCFEYPYQRASTHDKIKHWCFLTPIDPRRTRLFFSIIFDSDALCIPLTSRSLPYQCAQLFLDIAEKVMITPLLQQDRLAVEAEQEAFERLGDAPVVEFNPVTGMVQEMIVRRWQEYEITRATA
jgi:phenylpropionate dioxygenase-like ring-hydroxylating dioxygenase large terminal subunit